MTIRKSVSCQECKLPSSSSSSSSESDTPLKRFNRILRSSVARHWGYFRRDGPGLRVRGRSVSDAGLCSICDSGRLVDLEALSVLKRRVTAVTLSVPERVIIYECQHLLFLDSQQETFHRARRVAGAGPRAPLPPPRCSSSLILALNMKMFKSYIEIDNAKHRKMVDNASFENSDESSGANSLANHSFDGQALKPLSGSAPSVRVAALNATAETAEGKQPSKARQKKFQRHFPQVGPEERVLNYYSCALVGDLLLQGHLYITKNYFAFYSNVFGYVTKLLIPTTSVLRITKEKVARIIPNAVGVCTRDERHVFGSLLSRDSTYKLMMHVWKAARGPEVAAPKPQDLRTSEVELDASEYSPEDDSSSGGGEHHDVPLPPVRKDSEAIIPAAGAAVIQPALLTGGTAGSAPRKQETRCWRTLLICATLLLAFSASLLSYKLYLMKIQPQEELNKLSGEELYSELVRWRAKLHGRAANELHAFLTTNLLLLTKVRQSLEALSGVILTDMAQGGAGHMDVPNDTVLS